MPSGSPPSSRPYLMDDAKLVESRGTLREALGALGNLDQLLRSLRVGPKAISAVLPDVLDSCGPARTATSRLLAAAGQRLGQPRAVSELEDYFNPRLVELQEAIARATKTAMQARHRLELERVVTRITPELEAARGLIELLEEALMAPSIPLKLRELLNQITVVEREGSPPALHAFLEGPVDQVELLAQPQLAMSVLLLGSNLIADQHPKATPRIRVEAESAEGCTIHFEPSHQGDQQILVSRQATIGPTVSCLEQAVIHTGCSVSHAPSSAGFSVRWPG